MRTFMTAVVASAQSAASPSAASAQSHYEMTVDQPSGEQTFCGAPGHRALDFLLGEWLAYENSELMYISTIAKELRGCAILVRNRWLSDKYRQPGQSFRFGQLSAITFSDGEWTMLAADSMGGSFVLKGKITAPGHAEFVPTTRRKGIYIKGGYDLQPTGEIIITGTASKDGKSGWRPLFTYRLVPNR